MNHLSATALSAVGLIVALAAFWTAGCGSPSEAEPGGRLEGVTWRLASLQREAGSLEPVPDDVLVDARFEEGRVGGTSGCNSYSGPYTLSGSDLSFGDLASTAMACEARVMDVEEAYLGSLRKVAGWAVDGATLSLRDGAGNVLLTYEPQEEPPLTETDWQLTSYNNGKGAVVSADPAYPITARFGEDGLLRGSGGCNEYRAGYRFQGSAERGSISIEPVAATKMACPAQEQEQAYFAALPRSERYTILRGTLELRTADGAALALFQALP